MATKGSMVCVLWVLAASLAQLAAPGGAAEWKAVEQPDLKDQILGTKVMAEVNVGIPVFGTRMTGPSLIPNPDGKTYDMLYLYYRNYSGPFTAVVLDLGARTVATASLPYGHQFKKYILTPNGKFYMISTDHRSGLFLRVYDSAANAIGKARQITEGLIGETNPIVIGTDGKIYGAGSYGGDIRKAGIYQIDPETDKVTVYGPVGPAQDGACWGYSVAADDTHVYVASGKIPWHLVAYNRKTGKDTTLLTTERQGTHVHVIQLRHGAHAFVLRQYNGGSFADRKNAGIIERYWLHQGKAVPAEDKGGHLFHAPGGKPPWTEPEDAKPWIAWPDRPDTFASWAAPRRNGDCEFWYRNPADRDAARLKKPADPADAGPEEQGWQVLRYTVPVHESRRITGLLELPDGRLFGKCDAYQGNFIYDPKTYEYTHLGRLHLSQYAALVHEGKVYMSGYPSCVLYRYDPAKPWTSQKVLKFRGRALPVTHKDSNPRQIAILRHKAGAHKMWAAAIGLDGKLYFGGRWYRDGNCGGLGWWDTKKEEIGGFWKPFTSYRIHYMTATGGGKYIVISTQPVTDMFNQKPAPEEGKIFILDSATDEIVRSFAPVPKAQSTGLVAGCGGSRFMGIAPDPEKLDRTILYGADAATGKVHWKKTLPFALDWRTRHMKHGGEQFDFRMGPDGFIWTFCGPCLVRINPADAEVIPVGDIRVGGKIAFSGDDVYFTGTATLRKEPRLLRKLRDAEKK